MDFHADDDFPRAGGAVDDLAVHAALHHGFGLGGEIRCHFDGTSGAQHRRLVERLADDLKPERQSAFGQPRGHRKAG